MRYSSITKKCDVCGKEYSCPKCLVHRSHCCGSECRKIAQKSMKTMMVCPVCGKSFYNKGNALRRKYCSKKCSSIRRKSGVEKVCIQCGKNIYVQGCLKRENNFCGMHCQSEWQSKKISYVCKICGREFKRSPCKIGVKYCSIKCRTMCPDWKRDAVIAGNLVQQHSKKPTGLEIAGRAILDKIGVQYQEQVLICNKFIVDVLIPSKNIVIQWDGDYWHGFKGIIDERQKRRARLDKSQDAYMKKAGYVVIRFWEHEVKKEEDKVSENIRRAIQ